MRLTRAKIDMDDKLLSWMCLFGISKRAADESTMVSAPTRTRPAVCLLP